MFVFSNIFTAKSQFICEKVNAVALIPFSNLLAIREKICYNKIKKMIGRTLWEKFFVK